MNDAQIKTKNDNHMKAKTDTANTQNSDTILESKNVQ